MKNYIKDYVLSRAKYPICFIGGYLIVYFTTAWLLSYTNMASLEQSIVTSFMPALVYFLVIISVFTWNPGFIMEIVVFFLARLFVDNMGRNYFEKIISGITGDVDAPYGQNAKRP